MQPASTLSYFYTGYNQDGGGGAPPHWMPQDNSKPSQYQLNQWETNTGFHVTGGNTQGYGPAQVQGGAGQNRVNVGPQQPPQPQQPTPTSTPPGIHGTDMSKQPMQPAQINFVQRPINTNYPQFQRGPMPQNQQIRGPRLMGYNNMSLAPVQLTQAPAQTIVQTVPQQPSFIMYHQRQGTPYPNQHMFIQPGQPYNYPAAPYYSPVIQQTYQGMSSGGPSPQAGAQQPGQVPMMRPVLPSSGPPVQSAAKQEPKKRPNAIKIIDPNTNEEVPIDTDSGGNNNNITPTRSNDSSARETPQPSAGAAVSNTVDNAVANAVAAEFAARVAACAMQPDTSPDSASSERESEVTVHKQQSEVPNSEKVFSTLLSTSCEEFVPRSQKQPPQSCEGLSEEQLSPVVPTVSAETNSPAIEIQPRPKEPFPALKNPVTSGPTGQSPARKEKKNRGGGVGGADVERQPAAAAPVNIQMSPPPVEINKKAPKVSQKEEIVSLPKERRDKRSASKEQSPSPSPDITSSQPETVPVPMPSASVKVNVPATVEEPVAPPTKVPQHHNGETAQSEPPTVSVDGNKSSRPAKNKKGGKMREQLNRKGVEKEGSDMDAFTTEPLVSEEKERPATPTSPPATTIKMPPTPPPSMPDPIAPSSPVDKIKEDMEEKEDKLVAAKNEENAKVSALSKTEDEPAPVIEKPRPPQITLRHSYHKDQWSPLNPEGKKKYERDFLIGLKNEPQSNRKPENLPDVVTLTRDPSNNRGNVNNMFSLNNNISGAIVPAFLQRSSQSQRGQMVPKRGSQQGSKSRNNSRIINISLSLNEDVKLKTTKNAWKPNRLEASADKSEEEKQTEELYKNVRGILNKLTPQKFDTLMKKFQELPINSEQRLKGVINLIFDKAVDEPGFSKAYANMCKLCSKLEVTKIENNREEKVNFRKLLITRCQHEFETNKSDLLEAEKWLEEIHSCTDPEKKKELQLAFEEKERTIRRKSVGNIRFIGELFKLGMLTPAIMYRCIEHLLSTPEEESLECLCKLLTTIGKDLEFNQPSNSKPVSLNPYFQKMSDLAQKRDSSKVSSRVRFMLQDVIELRHNKWVPRREDNNPKTIEQINKEAERESMEMTIALNQAPPPRMNRQGDRGDDRKRGNRNNQSEDGWNTVPTNSRFNKFTPAFDSAKMQSIKPEDLSSVSLGGSSMFRFGNTGGAKVEPKTGSGITSSNIFSALSERKPPPQAGMNNRRITPTPSIERDRDRERQRMIQGVESEGRSSRGSSAQRERQQPVSRDSSVAPDKESHEPSEQVKREHSIYSQPPVDEKAARIAEEKLERQTITIFDEYLASLITVEEVKREIEQLYPADQVGVFVGKALSVCLEKKLGTQRAIGQLFTALMDNNLFGADVIVDQLSQIYEIADDISIDVPKVWELQAHVIVPILAAEKIDFSHIKAACSSVLKTKVANKLLVPILNFLVKDKTVGFVRKVWDSSNVSLADFLPADVEVDAFLKENSLEYLTGDAPKYDNSLPLDQVQSMILKLVRSSRPYENILEFIVTNVGDKVSDLQFIRALITAICEACITDSNNLNLPRFRSYEKLILRFVDNKEDRELACLSAVHILVCRLQHPQGLIKNVFNLFLEDNLISCESFSKWKNDDREILEKKGVSLLSLTSFFTALEEVETDDENS